MTRQLNLDRDKIEYCYDLAAQIVSHAAKYIDRHSSPAVERATLMLLGVGGDYKGEALASLMVEKLTKDQLRLGVANWWGRVLLAMQEEPAEVAEKLARGKIKWTDFPEAPPAEIRKKTQKLAEEGFQKWRAHCKPECLLRFESVHPQLAVHLRETKPKKLSVLAQEWHKNGIVLGISQLQSKNFFGETLPLSDLRTAWHSLQNFKTVAATEGLSMPEQTLIAMELGIPAVVLDGLTPVLNGAMDAKRALIDHSFALSLCAAFPMQILNQTISLKPPQLLAHLLLYEQFARRQGVSFENVMLAVPPLREKGIVGSLAFTQILREMFSRSPLWYSLSDSADPFSFVTARIADLDAVLLQVPPEKVEQAKHWLKETEGMEDALLVNTHGRIGREAHLILEQAWKWLRHVHQLTFWKALEQELPAVPPSAIGSEGVFQKSFHYWNPVANLLTRKKEDSF